MAVKIKDMSIEELRKLIQSTVRETIEDMIEDVIALNSPEYIQSIKEARTDYKSGKIKSLEEITDV